MSTNTNFNTPPYFDDYDETKRFHRILYRPSTAVQSRELTQSQTILQNQIERFGNHMFKDGSIISGVAITYYPNVHYISVEDYFNSNAESFLTDYDSTYLITNSTDSNTAVRAVIKIAKNGVEQNHPETNRLYLDYISTGTSITDEDVNLFEPGDTLYFYSPVQNKTANLDANNIIDSIDTLSSNGTFTSNGFAYCVGVSDGTIFQKGFFSDVDPQIITVRDFSTNVHNYVVGFNTEEVIVTENNDESLFDNALGYPNENAPGAHRLQLVPTLVAKDKANTTSNIGFFAIVEFDDKSPTMQQDDPVYNALADVISSRTYEESGDYVIRPFSIETRINSANSQTFYYEISPGVAYVRGTRIEKLGPTKVEVERAITTDVSQNQIVTANYGNYVICDEFLGTFDTEKLTEVTLYDTAQNAISDIEGHSAAVSGSIVGYANVKAVVYENGEKGTSTAKYLVYLFNIRMNSGKSFSSDVKSIYVASGGTFGAAKADIILENDIAVLKETSKKALLFPTGLSAVKRLTNNTGVGDTSFIFNQIKSGTLSANGTLALTIDSSASGGIERLNATESSVLTSSSIDNYNVLLSANAYTTNVGTIAITTGNSSIVGTNFTTDLTLNSLIRISANSTNHLIRRVISIANNTVATLDGIPAVTNATAVYQHFYLGGSTLPIQSVTINSNTSFTAELGANVGSGSQTVYASYPVNRTEAVAIPKVVNKNRFVKIDCSNNVANTIGPWNLGFADAHKIRAVYVGTTYANSNPDRTSWFNLDTGQQSDLYDHSKLVVKPQFASQINANTRILVEMDYFLANTTTSVGFFSVDSYPIDDANTANSTAIQTIELPSFAGIELRNCIDFRPRKFNTANVSATSISDATVNPPVSNSSFSVAGTGQYLIFPDNNFTADAEYYLSRIDLLTLTPTGNFSVVKGTPSVSPRTPFSENDQSVIAEIYVPAYPTPTKREREEYNTNSFTVVNLRTNRRYTMRDIGVLDERIKNLEYYTVLNLLEQQARDVTITDANGLDRFKNGIFADPFNSHLIGNVADFEYKIAIDSDESIARPYIERHDVDLMYSAANSTNIQKSGSVITLPYDDELYISQRFATKFRNVSQLVWQWNGKVNLYPAQDFFRDETQEPATVVNVDLSTPWEEFSNSSFGTKYGDWRTTSSGSSTSTSTSIAQSSTPGNRGAVTRGPNGFQSGPDWGSDSISATTTTTTTTNSTQAQTIEALRVNTTTTPYSTGSYVKDISISPYMRSRVVAFVSYNMKPNTTLHAFFDDVNIDQYCAPGVLSGLTDVESGLENRVVNQNGEFGDALVSDSTGFVCGVFKIPAQTFRTGDRLFQLMNIDDLVTGADAVITVGKAKYTADNVTTTSGSTTINVKEPHLGVTSNINTRTLTSTSTSTSTVVTVTARQRPPPIGATDPITQSFSIANIPDTVSGIFLTQIGLYFYTKDSNVGITVYVCEMTGNFPDSSKFIGQSYKLSSEVSTSSDATAETIFVFDYPIYLLSNKEYAFIVQADGNSPEYQIWVGETGGYDITTDEQVYSNPYSGMLFVSANMNTWTPIQKEDMKFKAYRAKFTELSGIAKFYNENDEIITINGFTRSNTDVFVEIGDIVYTVNSTSNSPLTSNTSPFGRIQYIDETTGKVWIDSSTGGFSNTDNPEIRIYRLPNSSNVALVNTTNHIASANILSVDNETYHAPVPAFGVLQPSKTNITFEIKGTSTSNVIDASYQILENNKEFEFRDTEKHLMSYSNEIGSLSGSKSLEYKLSLTSQSDFVSPVIDLSKKSSLLIENIINNDLTNEHTRYGNALTKYIGKTVILADGQEAEDVKVYLTAYRPTQTDIAVYIKFRNNEDTDQFTDKVWTKLEYASGSDFLYSSTTNPNDFREFEFSVPSANAVAYAAFANTGSGTVTGLTGTVAIANNSNELTGTGTAFSTELTVGEEIRVVSNDYFAIRTVTSIANNTYLTVDNGLQSSNTAALYYVFNDTGNDGIVEYVSPSGGRFIGYKEFAIKIVLLSENPVIVPRLNDVRAICLQI